MIPELLEKMTGLAPRILRIVLVAGAGIWLSAVLARLSRGALAKKATDQGVMLVSKSVRYGVLLVTMLTLLPMFGVRVTAVLTAAGVVGIAVGFAAQTTLSNLISGVFLIVERPFRLGDVLQVGDLVGLVHEIGLLAIHLRTFDNRFIRVPNEELIKTRFINITRFPIRRLDVDIGVAYKEDIDTVTRVLLEVADNNPHSLDEPAPIVIFKGFGTSSLNFMLGVWFEKADVLALRNSIMRDVKKRFDAEGIEIPFPHLSLYSGSVTEPFPVRIARTRKPGDTGRGGTAGKGTGGASPAGPAETP